MDGFWLKGVQYCGQAALGANRQVDAGIARARPGGELAGMNHFNVMPALFQLTHQFHQGGDNAVDLRPPGIGNQGNLHAVTAFVAWLRPGVSWDGAQCSSSSVPSKCSTSPLRLSTQSPSLQYRTPSMSRISAR